jgi:hypothetical protein
MIINNKLDKSFGPVGTAAGIFLFIIGIITLYSSWYGLILVLLGAFVGFSSTSTLIDSDNRRVKFLNNLFGIIQTGKWIFVNQDMKIGIRESNVTWRAYSRGNRPLDIDNKDFRLVLLDSENQEIMTLKKTDSLQSAKAELEILCNMLALIGIE